MKKVVSQLKRTLSTVLAMMMVVTALPQAAVPVIADEIEVLESTISPNSISFNVILDENAPAEAGFTSVSVNGTSVEKDASVSENGIGAYTVSANDVKITVNYANTDQYDAKAEIAGTAYKAVDGVVDLTDKLNESALTNVTIKFAEKVAPTPTPEPTPTPTPEPEFVVSYPADMVYVKVDSKHNSAAVSYKPATATFNGAKVAAKYTLASISGNNPIADKDMEKLLDTLTGVIKLPKGAIPEGGTVTVNVTGIKGDDETVTAPATVKFSTKTIAEQFGGIDKPVIVTVSANGDFVKNDDITDAAKGVYANGDTYKIVVPKKDKTAAVIKADDVIPAKYLVVKSSNKKVATLADNDGCFTVNNVKNSTLTVTFADGSKIEEAYVGADGKKIKNANKVTVYTKYAEFNPATELKFVVNGTEIAGYDDAALKGKKAADLEAMATGISGNLLDVYSKAWKISSNNIKNYNIVAKYSDCKVLNDNEFVFNMKAFNKKIDKKSVKYADGKLMKVVVSTKITVTDSKGKTKPQSVKATYLVKNNTEAMPVSKKIAVAKNQKIYAYKTGEAQTLMFDVKDDLVSANTIKLTANPIEAKNAKKESAYSNLVSAMQNACGMTVSTNGVDKKQNTLYAATLSLDDDAMKNVPTGSYSFYYTADDKTAPEKINITVTKKAPKAAITDLRNTSVKLNGSDVSGNGISDNLVFKDPGKKNVAVSINAVTVSNAFFKSTKIGKDTVKGYTNHFAENFKFTVTADGKINVIYVGSTPLGELAAAELTGYITYTVPASYYVKADGTIIEVASTRTVSNKKITIKVDKKK